VHRNRTSITCNFGQAVLSFAFQDPIAQVIRSFAETLTSSSEEVDVLLRSAKFVSNNHVLPPTAKAMNAIVSNNVLHMGNLEINFKAYFIMTGNVFPYC
jgi:hypothetical protein